MVLRIAGASDEESGYSSIRVQGALREGRGEREDHSGSCWLKVDAKLAKQQRRCDQVADLRRTSRRPVLCPRYGCGVRAHLAAKFRGIEGSIQGPGEANNGPPRTQP